MGATQMKEPLYVCVRVPEFPAQALLRLRPELAAYPIVVLSGDAPFQQVCSANVCGSGKVGGSACATHSECMANRCTGGLCESGKPDGSNCSSPADCVSQQCVNNVCTTTLG